MGLLRQYWDARDKYRSVKAKYEKVKEDIALEVTRRAIEHKLGAEAVRWITSPQFAIEYGRRRWISQGLWQDGFSAYVPSREYMIQLYGANPAGWPVARDEYEVEYKIKYNEELCQSGEVFPDFDFELLTDEDRLERAAFVRRHHQLNIDTYGENPDLYGEYFRDKLSEPFKAAQRTVKGTAHLLSIHIRGGFSKGRLHFVQGYTTGYSAAKQLGKRRSSDNPSDQMTANFNDPAVGKSQAQEITSKDCPTQTRNVLIQEVTEGHDITIN